MKLKIEKRYNHLDHYLGYSVLQYSRLWGWEWYDHLYFDSYDEAQQHAENIKKLN